MSELFCAYLSSQQGWVPESKATIILLATFKRPKGL